MKISRLFLFLVVSPVFYFRTVSAQTPDRSIVFPSDKWTLKSTRGFADSGEQISSANYVPRGWMKAQVPGTVLNSYVLNGLYPEPTYDLNNKSYRDPKGKLTLGKIPDANLQGTDFTYPHWFRSTFTLPVAEKGKMIWLNFSAINWKADIYLNGHELGTITGAFTRGIFNITSNAVAGTNYLAVKIYPLPYPGFPNTKGCGGDSAAGPSIGWTPAAIYQAVNWDFTFVDGIHDRAIGIYRDVYVTTTGPVAVRDTFMSTVGIPTEKEARLMFKAYLVNATDIPQSGKLKLESDGLALSKDFFLKPRESREIVIKDTDGLMLAHPKLWWPVGRGKPDLYDLKVSFVTDKGDVSDIVNTKFGVRSVGHDLFHGQHVFIVNGHKMFMQGGNWVSDAMLRCHTPAQYEAQVRLIAEAEFNWIRCWSGSGPESDYLFDACDKYGILVWVEAGLCSQTRIPRDKPFFPEFKRILFDNWVDTILRVRSHSSVFYYCGCNEGADVDGMADLVKQYDGTRLYQPNSQNFGQRGSPYRYLGINTLYDYSCHDLFNSGPMGNYGGFCNESGSPCIPSIESLREMMPVSKLWPIDKEAFRYHDGGTNFYRSLEMINIGAMAYGAFELPDMAGRVGAENYAFKAQLCGAMEYRAHAELWQRNKWNAADRHATGWALWTVNNSFPALSSRIYDYSLEPTAGLFYMAHGNKPLHAQYDYYANDISVVNGSFQAASGLTVRAEIHNLDWSLQWRGEKEVENLPEEQTMNGLLQLPKKETEGLDEVHFIDVQLFDSAHNLVDDMIYWRSMRDPKYGADGPFTALNTMTPARLDVSASVVRQGKKQVVTVNLKNPTSMLAFFTRVKIYGKTSRKLATGSYYSDNYFSISPGQSKTVTIGYPADALGSEQPRLIIEGWNVGTLEIPIPGQGSTPVVKAAVNGNNRTL